MNIEFPCPESVQNMRTTSNGFYCDTCNMDVLHTNTQGELSRRCVVSYTDVEPETKQTIRSFALAVVLVFGAGLFSISNAQIANELKDVKKFLEVCPAVPTEIVVTVQKKQEAFVSAEVWAVLPNGKEMKFKKNTIGVYHLLVPSYSKGKDVVVLVKRGNKVKEEVVQILPNGGVVDLSFVFRGKSIYRRYVTFGCPNF